MKVDTSLIIDHDSSPSVNNLSSGSSLEDSDRYSVTTSESDSNKERIQKSRCRSEKKRRDKLNLFIKDLQLMLPPSSSKRLDKSTVLKMTVDYLKLHNDLSFNMNGEGKFNKSFFLPCQELGELMLEILNGFFIIINEDAKIVYVADIVEKLLGVKATYYTNKTIHAVIHKDDQGKLTEELMSGVLKEDLVNISTGSLDMDMITDPQFLASGVSLDLRLLVEKENMDPEYRQLHCTGKWYSFRDQEYPFGDKLLVLLASLQSSGIREISSDSDAITCFSSKHSLDGKFLFADTDCLNVTGHLPYELLGKSIYIFVHDDDLMDLCKVHEKLTKMTSASKEKMTVYVRFRSKADEWLLFKSDFQLIMKPSSPQPDHIAVTFTLANAKETHEFRHFIKKKEFRIEDYLPNIFDGGTKDGGTKVVKDGSVQNSDNSASQQMAIPSCTLDDSPQESLNFPSAQEATPVSHEEDDPSNCSSATSPSTVSPNPSAGSVNINVLDEIPIESLDSELDKERFFEAQHYLHEQLRLKHESLTKNYQKQKAQLERIGSLMQEYKIMMQAPSFKTHYEQQQEMYDYFKYMVKKQHRKQEYLFKQLKGRVRELAIKQRAIKLRDLASRQQATFLNKMKDGSETNKSMENDAARKVEESSVANESNPSKDWSPNESNIFKFSQARSNANVVFSSKHNSSIQSTRTFSRASMATPTNEPIVTKSPSNVHVNFFDLQDKLKWLQQIQQEAAQLQQQSNPSDESSPLPSSSTCGFSYVNTTDQTRDIQHLNLLSEQLRQQPRSVASPIPSQLNLSSEQVNNLSTQQSLQTRIQEAGMSSSNSAVVEQPTNNHTEIELQSKISKQILIHLQALQKNILQQLQSVLHDKKETQSDFSQILPVLQQLQQLQQSIIEQQQNQQRQALVSPTQTTNTSPLSNQNPVFPNIFVSSNVDLLMMEALAEQSSDVLTKTTEAESAEDDNESRDRARRKLDKIKSEFNYQEQETNKTADCFENLGSPELSTLMSATDTFGAAGFNNSYQGDDNNQEDDMKKGKSLEEVDSPNFRPLMENQQHLEQLQQYQRMQIFMQQQQLHSSMHANTMQSINGQPGEENSLNDTESNFTEPNTPNIFTNSPSDFPLTGSIPDIFVHPENEEVMSMLLNDSEFYW